MSTDKNKFSGAIEVLRKEVTAVRASARGSRQRGFFGDAEAKDRAAGALEFAAELLSKKGAE